MTCVSECTGNKINAVMLSYIRMPGVWIAIKWDTANSLERIHPTNFDDRLWLRHFRMIKPTFERLWNEIGPLISPVIQSHPLLRQCHMSFFVVHWGIYSVNVVPMVVYAHFLFDKQTIRLKWVHLCRSYNFIYLHPDISIPSFFNATFQNEHKNRGMET